MHLTNILIYLCLYLQLYLFICIYVVKIEELQRKTEKAIIPVGDLNIHVLIHQAH